MVVEYKIIILFKGFRVSLKRFTLYAVYCNISFVYHREVRSDERGVMRRPFPLWHVMLVMERNVQTST